MGKYVPHDIQKIKGAEKEAMGKPLKDFCEYLLSKEGKRVVIRTAQEVRKFKQKMYEETRSQIEVKRKEL